MTTSIKNSLIFLIGGAFGGFITWLATRDYYEKKSIRTINNALQCQYAMDEVEDFKKSVENFHDEDTQKEVHQETSDFGIASEQVREEDMYAYHKIIGKYTKEKPPLEDLQKTVEDSIEVDEQALKDLVDDVLSGTAAIDSVIDDPPPYIITKSEFLQANDIYQKISLMYFSDEKVLIDEQDAIVSLDLVGKENLEVLDDDDERVIYVRNFESGLDIEVEKSPVALKDYIGDQDELEDED